MRKYYNYSVKKAVTVKNLTTIESLEATLDFSYPPEEHDFFELVYIDYGRLGCRLGERECVLDSGELYLDYLIEIHGARTERCKMTLTFH